MPSASRENVTCTNVRAASPRRSTSPARSRSGRCGGSKSPASVRTAAPTAAGAAGLRTRARGSRLTTSTLRHAPLRRIHRTSKRPCPRGRNAGRRTSFSANSTRRSQEDRTLPHRTDVPTCDRGRVPRSGFKTVLWGRPMCRPRGGHAGPPLRPGFETDSRVGAATDDVHVGSRCSATSAAAGAVSQDAAVAGPLIISTDRYPAIPPSCHSCHSCPPAVLPSCLPSQSSQTVRPTHLEVAHQR